MTTGTAAIVGVGTTDYMRRGTASASPMELIVEAIEAACSDAGLDVKAIDGFSSYSEAIEPGAVARNLGLPEVTFAAAVWGGGGGGSCAAIGNATSALEAGHAKYVVLYHVLRRTENTRFGGAGAYHGVAVNRSEWCVPYGLLTPAQSFAMIVMRHMHEFGTTADHLFAQASAQREHAIRNPRALFRSPLDADTYFGSRLIADPFRLFDCTLENDGAAAIVVTTAERARDLRQPPAHIVATAHGGPGDWGHVLSDHNAPSSIYASAGQRSIATRLYERAGIASSDIDVAQIYDHFSGMVLLALEDFGFCGRGEAGPFVAAGQTSWNRGRLPVNTHGGNLSEVNLHGTTHIVEGVAQMRGTSTSQVAGAELCLVTGGPSPVPSSAMILASGQP